MQGITRTAVVAVAGLVLVVGAGAAYAANGNDGLKHAAQKLTAKSQLKADVAERLGTTVEKLDAAVKAAALTRINAAQQAGDITTDESAALKTAVESGRLAKRIALPADIAKKLGTTEEKLNEAWTEAKKAHMKARVDQAVADGKITKEYGEELKQRIDEADFSAGGKRGHGKHGFGKRGFGNFGGAPKRAPSQSAQPAALAF